MKTCQLHNNFLLQTLKYWSLKIHMIKLVFCSCESQLRYSLILFFVSIDFIFEEGNFAINY